MNILIFSMTPLFPDRAMGGAQKQLKLIALYLAELGHNVTVVCTWRQDTPTPFRWHARVEVLPMLRFKQPFPEPYAAPAYHIAAAIQDVGELLRRHDVFYIHDGGLIFPYIYQDIPTVISLRSVIYSETQQAGFLFEGDALILISEHERRFYLDTAGRFAPEYAARTHLIPNGFDWTLYRPHAPHKVRAIVDVERSAYPVLLHPHRPEADKGLQQTIDVVDLLVHRYGLTTLKTLVPRWIDTALAPHVRAFYDDITRQLDERGLRENFIFHDWIPEALMPEYYNLGSLTLCLGSYVETFGNVPYESLGCGTPALVARVGPHRDNLPDALVDKVDFDDAETAAALAAAILREGRRTPPETLAYLRTHFSLEGMMRAYAAIITGAQKRGPLRHQIVPLDDTTRFRLAHWCYVSARGVYHDFRAAYAPMPQLAAAAQRWPGGFTFAQAGVARDVLMAWYRDGYVVVAG
ncbi:MAG: glycosyltransferase family 4 protein [Chloroflexi bacterium]|nr:glycosyltransferase family 4 protein [Chloroflexota bacterium]